MVKAISILGSTGSIGRQTAQAAGRLGIPVLALAARRDVDRLEEQARQFRPKYISVMDSAAAKELRARLSDTDIEIGEGEESLVAAATVEGADCVVTGISGSVGLRPTLAASELRRSLLTGPGGPFRGWTREQTRDVTPERAVRHPNWSMGAKISIDSATMMNKGLEFIEAMHLFAVTPDQIKVIIHPESAIHSMVELLDGTVIAQLGVADMGLPIQYALTYPERRESAAKPMDFAALGSMHFEDPDLEKLPCLRLAMECARARGTAPCVMSAANETAVGAFLGHRIGYNDIYRLVASAVERAEFIAQPTLEEILASDAEARELVRREIG